jgi:signal peptidase I
MRFTIERLVAVVLFVLIARTWLLDGIPLPCTVVGGSMAETLLGPHQVVDCDDCRYRFRCETMGEAGSCPVICPNCGYVGQMPSGATELSGDRVLIDKTAFLLGTPRRWDVVAFRRPTPAGSLAVKRVLGLPGETVQIRDGDVYVNGEIQRKSLKLQHATRILVHDSQFEPSLKPLPTARWHGSEGSSQWKQKDGCFRHSAEPGKIDWLVYGHWRRGISSIVHCPVTDLCSYNRGRPRREEDVHAVSDLMLSVRVTQVSGQGWLWLQMSDGANRCCIKVSPRERSFTAWENDGPEPIAQGELCSPFEGATVEVSLFDRQLLLAVEGRTLFTRPLNRSAGEATPPAEPIRIGCQGLAVTLGNLRVFRDVYYSRPPERQAAARLTQGVGLGDDEYFVLGDNSPISEDSRTWLPSQTVTTKDLVGRPLAVVFPAREVTLGNQHFQVPELSRIRYIR